MYIIILKFSIYEWIASYFINLVHVYKELHLSVRNHGENPSLAYLSGFASIKNVISLETKLKYAFDSKVPLIARLAVCLAYGWRKK